MIKIRHAADRGRTRIAWLDGRHTFSFNRFYDPAYMGFLRDDEVTALLNELLAAERAGARGVATMARRTEVDDGHSLLQRVAHDEAAFCAMLSRHLKRFNAEPTSATGVFYDRLIAMEDYLQQLAFLNRGQCWVVRKLRATRASPAICGTCSTCTSATSRPVSG